MTEQALLEATGGVWVIAERRNQAEYAFTIYGGIIKEIFKIKSWCPAGT